MGGSHRRICGSGGDPLRSPVFRGGNAERGGRLRGRRVWERRGGKGDERKGGGTTSRRRARERRGSGRRSRVNPQHTAHHGNIRPNRGAASVPNSDAGDQQGGGSGTGGEDSVG